MTNHAPIYTDLLDANKDIIEGKIGIIPTDTVYGLVVLASNKKAVESISKLKGRENKPGTIIASDIDQLVELGFKRRYLTAVEQFWPGPISIIIPTSDDLGYLHHGLFSLAVRIPNDTMLVKLLNKTGPLMTTSANLTKNKTAQTINEAIAIFGDKVDFYVDGGDLIKRKESTIIQINDDAIEVLREGAVKIEEETGRIINEF